MEFEEPPKPSMSFVQQLQEQVTKCREALSDIRLPLTSQIETLEALLWAKLKDDEEYNETMKKLNEDYKKTRKELKDKVEYWKLNDFLIPHVRLKAKEQFKAIMIFIDTKGYMPIE